MDEDKKGYQKQEIQKRKIFETDIFPVNASIKIID
jgi:hypothetical protein